MDGNPVEPDFSKAGGLVPAVAQDFRTGEVLMLAYMNREAWMETLRTGCAVYYSRSRGKLWKKGEQSGNVQLIREIRLDCDADAVLLKVEQLGGAACHTGHRSCFYTLVDRNGFSREAESLVVDPAELYGGGR